MKHDTVPGTALATPSHNSTGEAQDRYGFTLRQLKEVQDENLAVWKTLLLPDVYDRLVATVELVNAERTVESKGLHVCPRGWQLAELIMTLSPSASDDVI
jgi:hypothetical protein